MTSAYPLYRAFLASIILLAVVGCDRDEMTPNSVDKVKFASAWTAYAAMESATSVGISFVQFGPLLQRFATEVMLVPKSDLSEQEKADLATLEAMVQAYRDSQRLWAMRFDGATHNDEHLWLTDQYGRETFAGSLTVAARYSLPSIRSGPNELLVPIESVQFIWAIASDKGQTLAPRLAP